MAAEEGLDPQAPAKLFRALGGLVGTDEAMEEIGAGPLEKMVRLVLTDPDGEVWPYRVTTKGRSFDGKAIVALDRHLRGATDQPDKGLPV